MAEQYSVGDLVYADGRSGEITGMSWSANGNYEEVRVRFLRSSDSWGEAFAVAEVHHLSTDERLRRIEEKLGLE